MDKSKRDFLKALPGLAAGIAGIGLTANMVIDDFTVSYGKPDEVWLELLNKMGLPKEEVLGNGTSINDYLQPPVVAASSDYISGYFPFQHRVEFSKRYDRKDSVTHEMTHDIHNSYQNFYTEKFVFERFGDSYKDILDIQYKESYPGYKPVKRVIADLDKIKSLDENTYNTFLLKPHIGKSVIGDNTFHWIVPDPLFQEFIAMLGPASLGLKQSLPASWNDDSHLFGFQLASYTIHTYGKDNATKIMNRFITVDEPIFPSVMIYELEGEREYGFTLIDDVAKDLDLERGYHNYDLMSEDTALIASTGASVAILIPWCIYLLKLQDRSDKMDRREFIKNFSTATIGGMGAALLPLHIFTDLEKM
ncbi:MAG TPA: hypothetical protein VJH34_03730 [archaeon]|nr:hypothetical protein [archaeon]